MRELFLVLRQHPEALQMVGVIGFSLYITSFSLLQSGRLCGNSILYTTLIVTAASCVLISLITAFNLAAFLIQTSYVCIGLCGLFRRVMIKRRIRFDQASPVLRQSFAASMRTTMRQGQQP